MSGTTKPDPEDTHTEDTHTEGGAPTDKAHEDAGDGTLAGSVPAGLGSEELKDLAESGKSDDGGTG